MRTVLLADRLIDGTGGPTIDEPVVLISDGLITGVHQGHEREYIDSPGVEVLDYRGCTLLPGLIDAHVHTNLPGDGTSFEMTMAHDDGVLVASSMNAARIALESGITTVRDVGGRGQTTFDARTALRAGYGYGPRMLLAGQPMTITGGHCWYFGGEADGVDGVRAKVRELAKAGADWIKVIDSGGGTPNTLSHKPSFLPEELMAISDEAHRLDRRVTVHCLCAKAIEDAVAAQVDGIEHAGFLVDEAYTQEYAPRIAELMAEAGIPVTSTLAVGYEIIEAMDSRAELTVAEQSYLDSWRRMRDDNMGQISKLRDLGVKIIAGTDAGWRFTKFGSLAVEAWLLTEAGMTAREAVAACTGQSARVLGIGEETGSVTEGLTADIVAVVGDPTADLRQLAGVRMVMQTGSVRVTDGRLVRADSDKVLPIMV